MSYTQDILYNDRVRKVNKTIAYVANQTDQITVVGPTTEVIIHMKGTTTTAHTLNPSAGIVRIVNRVVAQTNRRGTIWDMSGVALEAVSSTVFNGERKIDTAAGGATEDGFVWVIPCGLDPGEMCTFTFTFGALLDIGASITALVATLRMTVVIAQPKTYWAFRDQTMGASGVIGVGADFTQPQIPIIPGFALCGGLANTAITDATVIVTNITRTPLNILLSHGDDYLINAHYDPLRALAIARTGAGGHDPAQVALTDWCGIPWHILPWRHTPVANNDSTQLTITNGPTATFGAGYSRVVYIYNTGMITREDAIVPPATKEVGGGVTLQSPGRVLSTSQNVGSAVVPAGTQGGTSIFNLRGGARAMISR
jgi:hypothetical protein